MKYQLIPVLSLALAACAPMPKYPVPEPFQPYVEKFQDYLGYKFDDIEYSFFNSTGNKVGFCRIMGDFKSIQIDSKYWNKSSDLAKEQLMFHELGHCVLRLQHNDTLDKFARPISIMNSYQFADYLYKKNYNSYIEELFK